MSVGALTEHGTSVRQLHPCTRCGSTKATWLVAEWLLLLLLLFLLLLCPGSLQLCRTVF